MGDVDALGNALPPPRRVLKKVPKAELRKIKQQVSKLRKKGHDVYTDDELLAAGYTLDEPEVERGLGAIIKNKRQSKSWDCGLACVEMVLTAMGLEGEECCFATLRSRLVSDSIWTIDLAYLLADFNSLAEDVVRVRMLFANCKAEGVHISKRYLSGVELWNLIREDENLVRVIVLVDARELANASHHDSFMGHFVLVTGLDEGRKGFFYKDPSKPEQSSFISCAALERARSAPGTDDDLLLIPMYQDGPTVPDPSHIPAIRRLMSRLQN
ncbi:MAG: hypothetical protein SGPRY_006357 [Prymnesium sp.]